MTRVMMSSNKIAVRAVKLIAGGLVGGVVGYFVGKLLKLGPVPAYDLGWSDHGALIIGALLLAMGVFIGLASLSGKLAGWVLDPKSGRAATPSQITFYRQQAIVLFLAGPMMIAPVLAHLFYDPVPQALGGAVLCGVVALFLVQTVYNLLVWRRGDELIRQITIEASAISFWVLQAALFCWAAAEKLGLAPAISAWDSATILMGTYLLVAAIVSVRRGYS
jgi:hypothetical protein